MNNNEALLERIKLPKLSRRRKLYAIKVQMSKYYTNSSIQICEIMQYCPINVQF